MEITTNLITILAAMAIIFIATLVQGIASFGFAMIALPLLNLLIPLQTVIPLLIIYGGIINIILLIPMYKNLELKNMAYLIIAGLIGTPLGTYLLLVLDESILTIVIGLIIVVTAGALWAGYRIKIKHEKLGNIIAGFLSGLLNGSLSMSGPPVILFYTNQQMEKQVIRANLAFYFLLLNCVTVPVLYVSGLFTTEALYYTFLCAPSLLIGAVGVLIGSRLGNIINNAAFTRITIVLISIMGVMSIISGVKGF